MNVDYPTLDEPATPEYVLAVLRDLHRLEWQIEFEQIPTSHSPSTRRSPSGDGSMNSLTGPARPAQIIWEIDVPNHEWKAVLKPTKKRRLRRSVRADRHACEAVADWSGAGFLVKRAAPQALLDDPIRAAPGGGGRRRNRTIDTPGSFSTQALFGSHCRGLQISTRCAAEHSGSQSRSRTFGNASALGTARHGGGEFIGAPLVTIGGIIFFFVIWLLGFVQVFFWAGTVEIRELSTFRDLAQLVADAPRLS